MTLVHKKPTPQPRDENRAGSGYCRSLYPQYLFLAMELLSVLTVFTLETLTCIIRESKMKRCRGSSSCPVSLATAIV